MKKSDFLNRPTGLIRQEVRKLELTLTDLLEELEHCNHPPREVELQMAISRARKDIENRKKMLGEI